MMRNFFKRLWHAVGSSESEEVKSERKRMHETCTMTTKKMEQFEHDWMEQAEKLRHLSELDEKAVRKAAGMHP